RRKSVARRRSPATSCPQRRPAALDKVAAVGDKSGSFLQETPMSTRSARRALALATLLLAACAPVAQKNAPPVTDTKHDMTEDRYLWLEDIHGERPLQWVEQENALTHAAFANTPEFETLR